jgi:hypothetical protein
MSYATIYQLPLPRSLLGRQLLDEGSKYWVHGHLLLGNAPSPGPSHTHPAMHCHNVRIHLFTCLSARSALALQGLRLAGRTLDALCFRRSGGISDSSARLLSWFFKGNLSYLKSVPPLSRHPSAHHFGSGGYSPWIETWQSGTESQSLRASPLFPR